jgi:peroxiredoxin/nitrate/TMAO reductase-like tetraheme cytochrome c subunit
MLWAALAAGCSDGAPSQSAVQPQPPGEATPVASTAAAADQRRTRPLPAFEGLDLDGAAWSTSAWVGKRTLVFGFDPSAPAAVTLARALAAIADEREANNFEVAGVAAADPAAARSFLAAQHLPVRSLSDPAGTLARRIGMQQPVWLVLTDSQGNLLFGEEYFPQEGPDPAGAVEKTLREQLRLPSAGAANGSTNPAAPDFSAERLEGGARFELASLHGRPAVLIFFLHTCPHCHEALRFLKDALAELPEATRPALVGVSVANRTYSVQEALREQGIDFFPVLLDPDASIRSAYGALQGVPVVFVIDAEGRLVSRTDGWSGERDAALLRMRLAKVSGAKVPMLLHKTGYSGNEVCAVCHESATATWELTTHASAYDTLVRHGSDHDAACVSCHVVGYGQPGGFSIAKPDASLENVGCETCHGRGGPHLSPAHAPQGAYQPVCETCHNPEHSLGFEYASFLPRVSHATNLANLALPAAEREKLLAERRAPRKDILPTAAAYVGSQVCQSCHVDEHATWSQHPHARAFATLAAKGEQENAACVSCHSTGLGKPGGFVLGAGAQPALAAVGCESCHGPGGDHVGEGARREGTIVKLSDKCGSCVILQVCGSCHDDANDPGFEFEVKAKIIHQRHGKEPLDFEKKAEAALPSSTAVGLLERAFASDGPG